MLCKGDSNAVKLIDFGNAVRVPRNADGTALRVAYRKAALAWHPDKHPAGPKRSEAQRRFEQANEAYSTLSDSSRRAEYDLSLEQGAQRGREGHAAGAARGRQPPRRPRPQTIDVVVHCSLEQLGGWQPVFVDLALARTRPELVLALKQRFGAMWGVVYLPASRAGDTVPMSVGGGLLELQLVLAGRAGPRVAQPASRSGPLR